MLYVYLNIVCLHTFTVTWKNYKQLVKIEYVILNLKKKKKKTFIW